MKGLSMPKHEREEGHNTMSNRYWDLDERERARLTPEQVEQLLKYELMEKGVAKCAPPVLEEPADLDMQRKQMFKVIYKSNYGFDSLDLLFETASAAQAFIDLGVYKCATDYKIGSEYVYAQRPTELAVEAVQVLEHSEIENHRAILERNKEIRETNARKNREYDSALTAVREASSGVWADYHEVQERVQKFRDVIERFDDYRALTDGDERLAWTFLLKIHDEEFATDAFAWHDRDVPSEFVAVAEEEPEHYDEEEVQP